MSKVVIAPRVMPFIADALARAIDAGGSNGYLELLDGTGAKANVIARPRFNYPCAERSTTEFLEFKSFTEVEEALSRGKVKWARACDSEGNVVFECPHDALVMEDDSVRRGDVVRIKSFRLRIRQAI